MSSLPRLFAALSPQYSPYLLLTFLVTIPATMAQKTYSKPDDATLKRILSPIQYRVTQRDGTEPPFKNPYHDHKEEGIYVDVVSGEPLFASVHKYDSKTGWPSFFQPLEPDNIVYKNDYKLFIKRTEVRSRHADSHLGHVFKESTDRSPSGKRYCINSAALKFVAKKDLKEQGYNAYLSLFQQDPGSSSESEKPQKLTPPSS